MELYMSFDLHSNNSYLGVVDGNGKRLLNKKLPIDTGAIKRLDNQAAIFRNF